MTSIPALTALYKNISRLDDERRAEIPGSAKYADMSDLIGRLERQFDDGLRQAARRRRRETETVRNEVVEALRREFAEGYARAKEIEHQPVRTAAVARQHNEVSRAVLRARNALSRLTGQSNSAVTAQAIGRSPAPVVQRPDITTTPPRPRKAHLLRGAPTSPWIRRGGFGSPMTLEETSTHAPRQYLKPSWIRHKSDMPAERQAYQHVGGNIYSVRPELQHARFQTMAELAPTTSRETHRRYHPYYADSAARRRSRRGRSRSRT